MTDMDYDYILDAEMLANDADAKTLREYFSKLALLMWDENEGVDGKRPFGNSSWDYNDVYPTLVHMGAVNGEMLVTMKNGQIVNIEMNWCDDATAAELGQNLIKHMGKSK